MIDFAAFPDNLVKFGCTADESSKETSQNKKDTKVGKYNKGDDSYGQGGLSQGHVPKENSESQKQSHYHSPRTITVSPAYSLHMSLMHAFPEVIAIAGKERLLGASDASRKLAQMAVRGLLTWSDLDKDMQSDDDHDSDYDADDETSASRSTSSMDNEYENDSSDNDDRASNVVNDKDDK
ncbi:MAG: hypothetical protein BYD32DRAFT_461182 [Podila humilis]|nr:MAG: hypothetical protein BYD32DRAFT_461182 [Podila humilis]